MVRPVILHNWFTLYSGIFVKIVNAVSFKPGILLKLLLLGNNLLNFSRMNLRLLDVECR